MAKRKHSRIKDPLTKKLVKDIKERGMLGAIIASIPDSAIDATANKVVRVPVKYRYDALHPDFLKCMAEIGAYADQKYGSWAAYLRERMTGDADPINHIYEHLREFRMREKYDHFDGDVRRHLIAIAYNAMMAWVAETRWGPNVELHALRRKAQSPENDFVDVPDERIFKLPPREALAMLKELGADDAYIKAFMPQYRAARKCMKRKSR